jgi:hypothetical protein
MKFYGMCLRIIVNFNGSFRLKKFNISTFLQTTFGDLSTFASHIQSKRPQHNQLASATGQWLWTQFICILYSWTKPEKRFAMPNKETAMLQHKSICIFG